MSNIYNSELIDRLYSEKDPQRAIEIGEEMAEISDAVFIHPLFSAYKRFGTTSVSHYFLSNIMEMKLPEAVSFLKSVANNALDDDHVDYLLEFYEKNQYFENSFLIRVKKSFSDEFDVDIDSYSLGRYLSYFQAASMFDFYESTVVEIFESDEYKTQTRVTALGYLFRYKKPKYFKHYLDNYASIKGKKSEIIFAKEVSVWENGIINDVKKKILEEGSVRAKEIIEAKNKKDEKVNELKEKTIRVKYNNVEIVDEIASLRAKINTFSIGDERFGFSIFSASELIYQQTEGPQDKQKLVGYCMELRSFIQNFNVESLSKHGVSEDEAKKFIPGITKFDGSINLLNIFLNSKSIKCDDKLFGLRSLNRVIDKLAHPDEESELVGILKDVNLYDLYKAENWPGVHKRLLEMYRDFLRTLFQAINKI